MLSGRQTTVQALPKTCERTSTEFYIGIVLKRHMSAFSSGDDPRPHWEFLSFKKWVDPPPPPTHPQ